MGQEDDMPRSYDCLIYRDKLYGSMRLPAKESQGSAATAAMHKMSLQDLRQISKVTSRLVLLTAKDGCR